MDIGATLEQAREKSGYSLEEMAEITNINMNYLQLLEKNQFEEISNDLYVRIFLKKYGKSLGLDYEALLAVYDRYLQSKRKGNTLPNHDISVERSVNNKNFFEKKESSNSNLPTIASFQQENKEINVRLPSLLPHRTGMESVDKGDQFAFQKDSFVNPREEEMDFPLDQKNTILENVLKEKESSSSSSTGPKVGTAMSPIAYPTKQLDRNRRIHKNSSFQSVAKPVYENSSHIHSDSIRAKESSSFAKGSKNVSTYPPVPKNRNHRQQNLRPLPQNKFRARSDELEKVDQSALPSPTSTSRLVGHANTRPGQLKRRKYSDTARHQILGERNNYQDASNRQQVESQTEFVSRSAAYGSRKSGGKRDATWKIVGLCLLVVTIGVTIYFLVFD